MAIVQYATAGEAAFPANISLCSPRERLIQKVASSSIGSPVNAKVNWNDSRVFTPGGLCGYQDGRGVEYIDFKQNGSVQLFRQGINSQGLIFQGDQVVGASVTSDIQTLVQRQNERKGTFIQYDKTRVDQEGADFQVDPTNYLGCVNYQGGHLIDHKYSAGLSHYTEKNYIPIHYFYNAPLKEYLVQRCDAYVEVPLYTPHPPTIGVKGQAGLAHPIPVGVVFVQLVQNKIQNVYYFPNNNFDYKGLKDQLGLVKEIAENMTAYFKLDPSFHALFQAALIINGDHIADGQIKQVQQEEQFFQTISDVSYGMSLAECDGDAEIISELAFSVLHEGSVNPFLCLDCDDNQCDELEGHNLDLPFKVLGEFLVQYGIRNALKSEVLSIKSRLVFINVIIDFIEAHSQVNDRALEFVDRLADEFKSALEELDRIMLTMNQEELFYLASTYQRLSDESNHHFAGKGYEIYDFDDIEHYFTKLVQVLKWIQERDLIQDLDENSDWNFLEFIQGAQETMDYLIDAEGSSKRFEKERKILKSMTIPSQALLTKQSRIDGKVSATFQTNIHRGVMMKTTISYLESRLALLGMATHGI